MDYYYKPIEVDNKTYRSLADYANEERVKLEEQARLAKMSIELKTIVKKWALEDRTDVLYRNNQ